MNFQPLSRRTVLRGVGTALALPWLEAMLPRASAKSPVLGPPMRIGFFYVPNGVHMPNWRPADSEPLSELPRTLQSLEPVKEKVLVISDLAADHCNGKSAAHEPAGGGFLVGKKCKHSEEPEVGGASVDQVAAREIGLQTPIDSVALGIDPGHRGDHGFSGTYLSHISWRSKSTPSPLELNPKQVYKRLFRDEPLKKPDWNEPADQGSQVETPETSVLDLVREDARSLQRRLGSADRRKLEEYFEGLRSVERRIASSSRDAHSHHVEGFTHEPSLQDDDPILEPLIMPEGKGIPSVYSEHVNLMLDVLTLAFQTDTTRVASFMFSYEKSGRAYPEIGAPSSHHGTSHHQGDAEKHEHLTRINTHHMELFAGMLKRMDAIDEGGSSMLDNVVFLYGSGISDGNKHNHDDLPILVAGGGAGTIRGGRHLKLGTKTPLCNLYLEMLDRVGVRLESFGDSTGRLGNLS